jgi:hypothetical protein
MTTGKRKRCCFYNLNDRRFKTTRDVAGTSKTRGTMDINAVLDQLRDHPAVTIHRGAARAEIQRSLKILKIRLPESYVEFLLQCGWADINGDVLYGLGPDAKKAQSVLENAIGEHVDASPPMLHELIPLMGYGDGNHACLDTTGIRDGDCPVVFWQHDHPRGQLQRPKLLSRKFVLWLARKVREAPRI